MGETTSESSPDSLQKEEFVPETRQDWPPIVPPNWLRFSVSRVENR
jgi:hypothetical protein